ncbi:MAG: hypothetical protein IKH84_05945, partial [Ottowia sp.]|nr:hypothetical protein [Ottowia sp.]
QLLDFVGTTYCNSTINRLQVALVMVRYPGLLTGGAQRALKVVLGVGLLYEECCAPPLMVHFSRFLWPTLVASTSRLHLWISCG